MIRFRQILYIQVPESVSKENYFVFVVFTKVAWPAFNDAIFVSENFRFPILVKRIYQLFDGDPRDTLASIVYTNT